MKYVTFVFTITLTVFIGIAAVYLMTRDSQRNKIEEELRWFIDNKGGVVIKWHVDDNDWEMSQNSNGKAIYGAEVERGNRIIFIYFDHSNSVFKEMLVSYVKSTQQANIPEPLTRSGYP